jgi:hypothetical protein
VSAWSDRARPPGPLPPASHPNPPPPPATRHEVGSASTFAPDPGTELVPVAGLAGLVSWWERHEGSAAERARVVPPRPSAAWSVADTPREAPRPPDGAFEAAPAMRLSLRTALEELLLAEARASGIEVDP